MGMHTSADFTTSNKRTCIHVDILRVQVALMDSIARTAFSSTANFEVRSSKLLNVRSCYSALCLKCAVPEVRSCNTGVLLLEMSLIHSSWCDKS